MKEETKEKIYVIFFSLVLILFCLTFVRFFVIMASSDTDSFCKMRFGEQYSRIIAGDSCFYIDYDSGIEYVRHYNYTQLQEICPEYGFFELTKWKKNECLSKASFGKVGK